MSDLCAREFFSGSEVRKVFLPHPLFVSFSCFTAAVVYHCGFGKYGNRNRKRMSSCQTRDEWDELVAPFQNARLEA
jgi:hypothetical protein